jgi:hypothetical protein
MVLPAEEDGEDQNFQTILIHHEIEDRAIEGDAPPVRDEANLKRAAMRRRPFSALEPGSPHPISLYKRF